MTDTLNIENLSINSDAKNHEKSPNSTKITEKINKPEFSVKPLTANPKLNAIFSSTPATSPFRYFICIDFEATCDGEIVVRDGKKSFRSSRTKGQYWQNEILSFPVVIVDLKNRTVCDEFHTFIQPTINPILTDYCKQLTGISQWQIDESPTFSEGLKKFEEYFGDQLTADNSLLVSDSSYDFTGFFRKQCVMSNISFPIWAQRWVNLKRLFVEFYGMQANEKQLPSLRNMVEMAGLKFEGKLHSGMDDVNNMAKLLLRMTADGLSGIMPNEVLDLSLGPPYYSLYKGKTIDQGAKRLERLLTGGAETNSFASKAKTNPTQVNKPKPRKVQLITKSTTPAPQADAKTFAQRVSEKLVKLPNAVQNLEKISSKTSSKTPVSEQSSTEHSEATKKGEIASTKVLKQPESTPEKSSIDNIQKPMNKLVDSIKPTSKVIDTTESVTITGPTADQKSVVRKRDFLLNIGVSVLVDNDDENLVDRIKLRLANFVAAKSTIEDPLPEFFNEAGLTLQDLAMVLKMSKGFVWPKIDVKRPKPRSNAKGTDNNQATAEKKCEQQKTASTLGASKRRSHHVEKKSHGERKSVDGSKKVLEGVSQKSSSKSPKRSPNQKENERPKSKINKNSKKQPSDGKTKRKCDVKSKANNAEKNPEKQNTEKMNADKKESHKTEQKEKPTPVLSEIAAN